MDNNERIKHNLKIGRNIGKLMNDYNKLVDFTVGINSIKLTFYDNKCVSELDIFINNDGNIETTYNSEVKEIDFTKQKEEELKSISELMSNSVPSFEESLQELSDEELMSLIGEENEEDDFIKAYDEWEASMTPEERKEAFVEFKKGQDKYLLSKDYEIEDDLFSGEIKIMYTKRIEDALFVMGYEVTDISLAGQKEVYLLAQKNSVKFILMGGLYKTPRIRWTEKILNVNNLLKQNKASTGLIVTNRPADDKSINYAIESGIVMLHEYDIDSIIKEFYNSLLEYEIFQLENEEDDWNDKINRKYLGKFYETLGYKIRTVKIMDSEQEIGWELLIEKKTFGTLVRTAFKDSEQGIDIIKDVILAIKYYNNNEDYDGYYRYGIIISNKPFSNSEIEFAKTNEIYTVSVTSMQDIIWELLQFEI